MARSEDRFLVRETEDVSLDGEIWGLELNQSDGGKKTYGIAGADGQAEAARKTAEEVREQAESARVTAERERVDAQNSNDLAQAKNNADQAANNAAAQGLQVVKLDTGQYDTETLTPTIEGQVGKLYFVPIPSAAMSAVLTVLDQKDETGNAYLEWMWIDGGWERVGMSNATLIGITTDYIDRVASGEQLVGEGVLNETGLTYLWAKFKTAFAALSHRHSVADVDGAASQTDLDKVRDSLSQHEKGDWIYLYASGDQYVKARKAGHFVTVCWSFKFDGISSWSCKLPEQFAPDSNHYAPAVLVNENNSLVNTVAMAAVYQEQIMFRSAAKADKCWHEGCFTYPV